jgi:hypothetical protein
MMVHGEAEVKLHTFLNSAPQVGAQLYATTNSTQCPLTLGWVDPKGGWDDMKRKSRALPGSQTPDFSLE